MSKMAYSKSKVINWLMMSCVTSLDLKMVSNNKVIDGEKVCCFTVRKSPSFVARIHQQHIINNWRNIACCCRRVLVDKQKARNKHH